MRLLCTARRAFRLVGQWYVFVGDRRSWEAVGGFRM